MKSRWKSILLVVVQFACLTYLFLTAPIVARSLGAAICQLIGAWIGVWAVWCMRPGNFNIEPEVRLGATLVTSGPYRLIRHPMYLSLLLIAIPLVISYFSYLRLVVLIIFTINMIVKMIYEEHLLMKTFPEYEQYRKRSKRLVPFIW
jgi:protein-S-isoprenylcysteine O-methyltransferase Ste14